MFNEYFEAATRAECARIGSVVALRSGSDYLDLFTSLLACPAA